MLQHFSFFFTFHRLNFSNSFGKWRTQLSGHLIVSAFLTVWQNVKLLAYVNLLFTLFRVNVIPICKVKHELLHWYETRKNCIRLCQYNISNGLKEEEKRELPFTHFENYTWYFSYISFSSFIVVLFSYISLSIITSKRLLTTNCSISFD